MARAGRIGGACALTVRQWTKNKSLSSAENSSGANFFWTKSWNQRMPRTCVSPEFRTPGFTPHLLGIGYIFPDPESVLETSAKARREKQTSEHRVIVVVFLLTHWLQRVPGNVTM